MVSKYLNSLNETQRKELEEKLHSKQSGKCHICDDSIEFGINQVDIDHINGKGSQHTASISYGKRSGSTLYRWLIKHYFPEGYQTLCMNCQWVKRCEGFEYRYPPPYATASPASILSY